MASIDYRSPLYGAISTLLSQAWSAQGQQGSPLPRHIVFPFHLRDHNDFSFDDPEERTFLFNVFPGTSNLLFHDNFIYLQVSMLPPKPWRLTVAGVPLYFYRPQMQTRGVPTLKGNHAWGSRLRIATDQNGRDMEDWGPLFHIVRHHFRDIGVAITEVMYFSDYMCVVLEHRDTDRKLLPRFAADVACLYLFEDEMARPSTPQARRLLDPAPGNPDVSRYHTLQPGQRLSSAYLPDNPHKFLATTSGVLVKDQAGNEFMTAAAHGFPGECGTSVWHPFPSTGREIGEVMMEVPHTGIALVKLQGREAFSNVTFRNESVPVPIRLKTFVASGECETRSIVCLDSPDTGYVEGVYMVPAFRAFPGDDGPSAPNWVKTIWCYMGQDSASALPQEMRGSVMWDSDGNVLGFFRYAAQQGPMVDWCAAVAADELIDRGYTLVDTSDRT